MNVPIGIHPAVNADAKLLPKQRKFQILSREICEVSAFFILLQCIRSWYRDCRVHWTFHWTWVFKL